MSNNRRMNASKTCEIPVFTWISGIISKRRGNVPTLAPRASAVRFPRKAWLSRSNLRDGVPPPQVIEKIRFQDKKNSYHLKKEGERPEGFYQLGWLSVKPSGRCVNTPFY